MRASCSCARILRFRESGVNPGLFRIPRIAADAAAKLQELAKKAASTLKALDAFSGADLAKALVPEKADSKVLVWRTGLFSSNAAAKAATAAIKAQQALSEELAKFNGRLAANDNVDAKLQDAFMEMQFQADRRSTEILSIAARMYDLALQDAAAGPGGDPKMKALLSATFSELMPREAILMHGTAEALELMNKHMADKMGPLAEKLDALQARGGAILSNEEIVALETDMRTMKEALADVRNNGLQVEGGHLEVDKSLLDGMEKTLDAAWDTIQNARADMAQKARKKKNKVVAADDWSNPDTVRNLAKLRKSVTLPSTQGQGIHKSSRDSRHVSNFLIRICPSYFRRDYMGDSIPW